MSTQGDNRFIKAPDFNPGSAWKKSPCRYLITKMPVRSLGAAPIGSECLRGSQQLFLDAKQ